MLSELLIYEVAGGTGPRHPSNQAAAGSALASRGTDRVVGTKEVQCQPGGVGEQLREGTPPDSPSFMLPSFWNLSLPLRKMRIKVERRGREQEISRK